MTQNVREQIAETRAIEQEVRETLQGLGPNHPLYSELIHELDDIAKKLTDLEKQLEPIEKLLEK